MDKYEIIESLANGSVGSISKIRRKSDGKILVWKEINYGKMNTKDKQHLVSEVNVLREIRHDNIVKYYDRIVDKRNAIIYIVMEFCEGGDLAKLIRKCKKAKDYIAEDVIWKIASQVALALDACHNRDSSVIIHRDIKPGNIFLDRGLNIKLGDFGLARILSENSIYATTNVGTPYYMSPEQIEAANYTEKSDIWSVGCLLYELSSLRPPFSGNTQLALALAIKEGVFHHIPSRYSQDLAGAISSMLQVDYSLRPSSSDLLKLPQIALRLRERSIRASIEERQWVEDSLKQREEELSMREDQVLKRETAVSEREVVLQEREQSLQQLANKLQACNLGNVEPPKVSLTEKENKLRPSMEQINQFIANHRSRYQLARRNTLV